jgi:hypothetical protein
MASVGGPIPIVKGCPRCLVLPRRKIFRIASNDEFVSKERGHNLMTTRQQEPRPAGCAKWLHWPGVGWPPAQDAQLTACLSGSSRATTTQLQPPRDDWMATQDARRASRPWEQPPKHGQSHGSGLTARHVAAMAWDGPAAGTKLPAVDRPDGYTRRHESVEAAGAAFGACQVAAMDWDGPAAGTTRPVGDNLTHVANKEAPALSARHPYGSVTRGKHNAVAQAGPRDGVKSNDKDRRRKLP